MKRSTVVVVMIAMLVAAPGGASAQSVTEGARVRITREGVRSVGTLTEQTDQHVTLRLDSGSEIRVADWTIEKLEFASGKRGNAGKGALIGAVSLGLVGALGAPDECLIWGGSGCRGENVKAYGLAGALTGALVGLIVGSLVTTERWERVDSGPQLALTLPKRGIGAQVQVGW